MKKNYNDIEHIEAWVRGEMDETTRQSFEAQMAFDKDLQEEVAAYRQLYGGFRQLRNAHFAAEVAQWTQEAKKRPSLRLHSVQGDQDSANVISINRGANRRQLYRRLALAASVVLLMGITVAWWGSQQYSNEKLIAGAYSPPLSSATMGNEQAQASEWEKGFAAAHLLFQQKKYADAAAAFETSVRQLESNPSLFDALTGKSYLDNARWSLLLAKFAAGQTDEAAFTQGLEVFVRDPASDYADEAKEIQQNMKSFWRMFSK
jgi:hypothetical protein